MLIAGIEELKSLNHDSKTDWDIFMDSISRLFSYQVEEFLQIGKLQSNFNSTLSLNSHLHSQPNNEDWEYLLESPFHQNQKDKFWMKHFQKNQSHSLQNHDQISSFPQKFVNMNPIYGKDFANYFSSIFFILHLLYENYKLTVFTQDFCPKLLNFLYQLSLLFNSQKYQDYYLREGANPEIILKGPLSCFFHGFFFYFLFLIFFFSFFIIIPYLFISKFFFLLIGDIKGKLKIKLNTLPDFEQPPNILHFLTLQLSCNSNSKFPNPMDIATHFKIDCPKNLDSLKFCCLETDQLCTFYNLISQKSIEDLLLSMCKLNFTPESQFFFFFFFFFFLNLTN